MTATDNCDFCGAEYVLAERRVVAFARPSDPSEITAVMWGCGRCPDSAHLPTAQSIIVKVENGVAIDGVRYLFANV